MFCEWSHLQAYFNSPFPFCGIECLRDKWFTIRAVNCQALTLTLEYLLDHFLPCFLCIEFIFFFFFPFFIRYLAHLHFQCRIYFQTSTIYKEYFYLFGGNIIRDTMCLSSLLLPWAPLDILSQSRVLCCPCHKLRLVHTAFWTVDWVCWLEGSHRVTSGSQFPTMLLPTLPLLYSAWSFF
jgi:hypothetical protein